MITQRSVIMKLQGQGCVRDEAGEENAPASFCFRIGETTFFIPKSPNGLHYPPALIDMIEKTIAPFGLESVPKVHEGTQ
jgi:hypothetical protein